MILLYIIIRHKEIVFRWRNAALSLMLGRYPAYLYFTCRCGVDKVEFPVHVIPADNAGVKRLAACCGAFDYNKLVREARQRLLT